MTGHASAAAHDDHDHGFAHPMPVPMLLAVFFALVFLTIVTVAQASLPLGSWEVWASLMIASVKAALVMYFFMHLGWDKPFNALIFLSTIFFLALFLGFTLMDAANYENALEPTFDEVPVAAEAAGEGEMAGAAE